MAVARGRNGADAAYEQARTAVVKIGIPREVKNNEFRVGITPVGVHELVNHGHTVYIEKDAGVGSSITDEDFVGQGAQILDSADDVWGESDMVMKVKEPVAEEYHRLREDLLLYTYLHLAADEPLTEELVAKKVTAVAYETVQLPSGMLPLLYPMSEVAGCLAPQVGAMALMRANGGRGVLMGGVGGGAALQPAGHPGGVALPHRRQHRLPGRLRIRGDRLSVAVRACDPFPGHVVSLPGRFLEPLHRQRIIDGHSPSVLVHYPEVVLGLGMSLLRRPSEPADRVGMILGNTLPGTI